MISRILTLVSKQETERTS